MDEFKRKLVKLVEGNLFASSWMLLLYMYFVFVFVIVVGGEYTKFFWIFATSLML